MTNLRNKSRLDECGWTSFRAELFLNEPGRKGRLADSGYVFLGFKTPYQELSDSESFEYDPLHQVKTTPLHWDVVDEQGTVRTISEGFERMKLTYPCELDLLLKHIGLRIRHKWGDADRSPFNDPCNQEYHYLVEKDEPPG